MVAPAWYFDPVLVRFGMNLLWTMTRFVFTKSVLGLKLLGDDGRYSGLLGMDGQTDEPGFFSGAGLNVLDPVEWMWRRTGGRSRR